MKPLVILGLSGGVDSAVAAELLKADYEVEGLYLDNGLEGADAARRAAGRAGIPLAVADMREALEKEVCAPFAAAYMAGRTPNPCVLCNPAVKLAFLCRRADERGAACIATGHYARSENGRLYMGQSVNDQSYMLCRVTPEQARRLLLPLGQYTKQQVRAMAREWALPAADRPDSMEICFIPGNDYAAWLSSRGLAGVPGDVVYHGRVVGRHTGVQHFTVGQGSGLGVALGHKVFVTAIRAEAAVVELGEADELSKASFAVESLQLFSPQEGAFCAGVRVRHSRRPPVPCRVTPDGQGGAVVECDEPVRAPAPGQAAAFYDGELLLGGAIIC